MNIALVPAAQVPKIFSERIRNRLPDEAIFVTSMSAQFDDNPIIENLAKYSTPKDTFVLDYFGHWHGFVPNQVMSKTHKNARSIFNKKFNGSYVVAGPPPRINLTNSTILNRNHVKAYAVGNKILSLGGVNCVPASYKFIDLMLDFKSDKFLAYLHKLSDNNGDLRQEGYGEGFWLDDYSEVLVDYGNRKNLYGYKNKSVILDSLLNDLEKDILSATLSSTYIPYGKLDNILNRHVQKQRRIAFYTNKPDKFVAPHHSSFERWLQKFYSIRAQTPWIDNRPDKFNHLKAAIINYPSGDKVAYIGSHNFHELPVWAGTAEISLRTTNRKLIRQLEKFMKVNLVL